VERAGGEQAEVNFGDGLDRSVPRQRTGPTLVRAAQSELGDFLQPTKLSRLTYKATRAGMAFLLSVNGSKVRYIDSPIIVLGSPSPYVNNSQRVHASQE
jgi:hypothetical protein